MSCSSAKYLTLRTYTERKLMILSQQGLPGAVKPLADQPITATFQNISLLSNLLLDFCSVQSPPFLCLRILISSSAQDTWPDQDSSMTVLNPLNTKLLPKNTVFNRLVRLFSCHDAK